MDAFNPPTPTSQTALNRFQGFVGAEADYQDQLKPDTQKIFYDAVQKLVGLEITPQDLANIIDDAAEKSYKASLK